MDLSPASGAVRRVIIADDEPFARERLRMLLASHPAWRVVAECEHGLEAVEAIAREKPDLVFLDIRMPELSGIEVVEALETRFDQAHEGAPHWAPTIVFVTAHEEYALRAFQVRALDYLLKPVDQERLDRTLAMVEERQASRLVAGIDPELRGFLETLRSERGYARRFLVRDARGGLYFVKAEDIEWVDARGNYVSLHAGGRAHLVRGTMKAFEARLDPANFVRVHRSAIVNLDRIQRLEPHGHGEYLVTLRDGTKLRTSRAHSARLQALLG
jgi:two-component system, LytTR family, response regulator